MPSTTALGYSASDERPLAVVGLHDYYTRCFIKQTPFYFFVPQLSWMQMNLYEIFSTRGRKNANSKYLSKIRLLVELCLLVVT